MRHLLLALALVTAGAAESPAAVIFFDDFESEPVPPDIPGFIGNYDGFQHWDVVGSGVDLVGPGSLFPPRIDSLMVDLDGTSGSTLITKQTFDLFPGTYTLMFGLGGPVGGEILDTVEIALGTVFSESITIQRGDPFVTFTRTIVVSSATTGKLSFTDLGADSNGAFLDNVKLASSAVPEPSTFLLLMLGLAFCVGAARIRRCSKSAASHPTSTNPIPMGMELRSLVRAGTISRSAD